MSKLKCKSCNGQGWVGEAVAPLTCDDCGGTGIDGTFACPECHGTGVIFVEPFEAALDYRCPTCDGDGTLNLGQVAAYHDREYRRLIKQLEDGDIDEETFDAEKDDLMDSCEEE